ncbi:uncharacterized protein LOC100821562 [Brachypodium distachyon]|uniref:uncharacterized protein LOC100821562 n=1 Tax=Brachypodium distachyon TaxID=15368 RepID=UPI00052FDF01|nr:uncharacterized protein LOC100821562 [Brachypodium distachyon]|eukprot:XP_010229884.1 uncharacterized protein LOC100821562 [Brachypodium distachyon]
MEQRASPYKSFEHRSFYVPSALVPTKKSLRFGPPSPDKWRLGLTSAAEDTARDLIPLAAADDAEERTETDPNIADAVLGMSKAVDNLSVREEEALKDTGVDDNDIARLTLGRTGEEEKTASVQEKNPTVEKPVDGLLLERQLREKLLRKRKERAATRAAGAFLQAKVSILGKKREGAEIGMQSPQQEDAKGTESQALDIPPPQENSRAVKKTKITGEEEGGQDKEKVRGCLRNRLGLSGFAGVDSVEATQWRLSCIYGEPCTENRAQVWAELCNMHGQSNVPWLVIGDFNEALSQCEHLSVSLRPEAQMRAFRETLYNCGLLDLGYSGVPYTYNNGRSGSRNVQVGLDWAVVDDEWSCMFGQAKIEHLTSPCSDHNPVLLCLLEDIPGGPRMINRQYELFWERAVELLELVAEAWNAAQTQGDLGAIITALEGVMRKLQGWSKGKFGNILKVLETERSKLNQLCVDNADAREIRRVNDRINELLYQEELLWMQRSRIDWIKAGDRNTKFFHQKAVWRVKKNKIVRLCDANDSWVKDAPALEKITIEYFQNIFSKDVNLSPHPIVDILEEKISDEMNNQLCREFTREEILDALFQIGLLKAPGLDGFPARFYQRNWVVLREDVIQAVLGFFRSGHMTAGVNNTSIVLIPKVAQAKTLKDFWPISLCSVLCKIVAKCLVNRMRPLLDEIVSENQSAFVPGRLITDNALVAFACFHYIGHNNSPTNQFCAYKLDLSKAYDRVDWDFLRLTLEKLGFAKQWVEWIMVCVTTVNYSVKFNGKLLESFAPTRGLRQGDPLSPFLFLFVVDGLSALLKRESALNNISPLKVCRRAPGVSHLLFTDDTLLFFKAEEGQARRVQQVLNSYACGTGQLNNVSKCSLLFGKGCDEGTIQEIKTIL